MKNSTIAALAIGALVGAALVEGHRPTANLVSRGKKAVTKKVDEMMNKQPQS